jgi:hypothetical protein
MTVANAVPGNDVIGERLSIAHIAFPHGDFEAIIVVDVHGQRGGFHYHGKARFC